MPRLSALDCQRVLLMIQQVLIDICQSTKHMQTYNESYTYTCVYVYYVFGCARVHSK